MRKGFKKPLQNTPGKVWELLEVHSRGAEDGGDRLAGNSSGVNSPATDAPPASTPTPGSGVTATLVTNVSSAQTASSPAAGATAAGTLSVKSHTPGAPLRFHTVTPGDTLSEISNIYYGTPTRWAEILVANKDILGEDNNLVIGRTLRIP